MNLLDDRNKPYFLLVISLVLFFLLSLFFFLRDDTVFFDDLANSVMDRDQSEAEIFAHYYRKANQAFLENDIDAATGYLERIANLKLNSQDAYAYNITKSSIERKKLLPFQALETVEEALTFQETAFAHYLKALILEEVDKVEDAIVSLEAALAIDENFQPAHEKMGDIYFFAQDFTNAMQSYSLADVSGVSLPSITLKLAFISYFTGNYRGSVERINSLRGTEKNKNLPLIYFLQAINYFKMGNTVVAEENFEKSIASALPKQRAIYLYYRAMSNIYRKDYSDANKLLSQALVIMDRDSPLYARTKEKIAETAYLSGDFEKAKKLYKSLQTADHNLESPLAVYNLGVAYYQTEEYEKAIPLLLEVLDTPLDVEVLQSASYLLAKSYSSLNMYGRARNTLAAFSERWGESVAIAYTLLELEANHSEVSFLSLYNKYAAQSEDGNYHLILAQYFINVGDNTSAINILTDYVEENPTAMRFKKLADLYGSEGEYDLSLYYYKKAEELTGSSEKKRDILNNKAFILAMNDDLQRAKEILLELESSPGSKVAQWYNLALVASVENDEKEYVEKMRKAYLYIDDAQSAELKSNIYLHYSIISARAYRLSFAKKLIDKAYEIDKTNEKISFIYKNGFETLMK